MEHNMIHHRARDSKLSQSCILPIRQDMHPRKWDGSEFMEHFDESEEMCDLFGGITLQEQAKVKRRGSQESLLSAKNENAKKRYS
jgi:hypothetical protein